MVSLLMKIVKEPEDRLYFVGMIVIAANSGGVWSPIGDVTTTMLWLGGQITAGNIIKALILPSVVSLIIPLIIITPKIKGRVEKKDLPGKSDSLLSRTEQLTVLLSGVAVLLMVPVFKMVTHLPPYMGILIGLGIMWVIAERIGGSKEGEKRYYLSPAYALRKIDSPSILFFLGILLCIAALERAGVLISVAASFDAVIGNKNVIVLLLGLLSAIIDNVPLMASAQGMYPVSAYPVVEPLWNFLAYCTGTGGSILIIGSAAGVAVMGIAKVNFFWYLKNISWLSLLGYFAGAATFLLMQF